MNGIDRISQRILDDARGEAARIIEEAQERARSLKKEKIAQTEKDNERLLENSNQRAKERKQRMLAMAGLEMRKEVLASKQEIIHEAMKKAKEALVGMPRDEYRRTIINMILESARGDEEVVFSNGDVDRLDQSLVDEANQLLISKGKKGELKLAPEREDFHGGFILKSKGMEINNTFGSIIRMSRDEMESELAMILFGEEG